MADAVSQSSPNPSSSPFALYLLLEGQVMHGNFRYQAKGDPLEVEDTNFNRRDGGAGLELLHRPTGLSLTGFFGFEAYDFDYIHTRFDDAKTSDIYLKVKTSGDQDDLPRKIPATLFGKGRLTWNVVGPPEKAKTPWSFTPSFLQQCGFSAFVEFVGSIAPKRIDVDTLYIANTGTQEGKLGLEKLAPVLMDSPYYRSTFLFIGGTPGISTHGMDIPLIDSLEFNITAAWLRLNQAVYYDLRPEARAMIEPFLNSGDNFDPLRARFVQNAAWGTLGLDINLTRRVSFLIRAVDFYFAEGRTEVDVSIASLALRTGLAGTP